MEKIKKAYSWFVDTVWPLSGTISEEIIILAIAAIFSSSGYGIVTNWVCIWSFIAIVRIAVYGKTIDKNCE